MWLLNVEKLPQKPIKIEVSDIELTDDGGLKQTKRSTHKNGEIKTLTEYKAPPPRRK
jgi:hypothetical protein